NIRTHTLLGDHIQRLLAVRGADHVHAFRREQHLDAAAYERIVFDHQDRPAERRCGGSFRQRLAVASAGALSGKRNDNRETGPLPGARSYIDRMAEQVAEALHDRKPKAEAAQVGTVGDLVILVEDTRQMFFGDADTAVPDFNADIVARAPAAEED